MGIQEVTGKGNAYVITADVPKPTDSRGKGYGSMYTDMRWQIWEQVQKSSLAQMNMDFQMYETQRAAAQKAIDEQRAIVADLKEGKISAQDALAQAKAGARFDLLKEAAAQKKTYEKRTKDVTSKREFRGPKEGASYADDATSDDRAAVIDTQSKVEEWRGGDGSSVEIDEAIKHANTLIQETVRGTDMTQEGRTRGITPEGTNYYYTNMVKKVLDTEFMTLRNDPQYSDYSDEELQEVIEDIARENLDPVIFDAYDKSVQAGTVPTSNGKPVGQAGQLYKSRVETGETVKTTTPTFKLDDTNIDDQLKKMFADEGADYDTAIDEAQSELQRLQGAMPEAPGTNLLERTRKDFAQKVGTGGFGIASGNLPDLAFLRGQTIPSPNLLGFGTPAVNTEQRTDKAPIELDTMGSDNVEPEVDISPEPPQASAKPPKALPISAASATPSGAEVPKVAAVVAPDLKKRRNYRAGVIQAGAALASKPKQFARKYKTGLNPEERKMLVGEHIAMVDELYNTNVQNKSNDAYAATWKELSKSLGDNPALLKEAHTYLVARDMVENTRTT